MEPKRFVILEHFHEGVHYDLMFEVDGVLRTWKLSEPPLAGVMLTAVRSFDHRLRYLDYEGPIDGNRGRVVQWDRGVYEGNLAAGDPASLRLAGKRLQGMLQLKPVTDVEWEITFGAAE